MERTILHDCLSAGVSHESVLHVPIPTQISGMHPSHPFTIFTLVYMLTHPLSGFVPKWAIPWYTHER